MISYCKAEIEDLARATSRRWGGQTLDWRLVVEPIHRNASSTIALQVEIALDGCTRITSIPLGNHDGCGQRATALASAPQAQSRRDAAVAAVRRASVQALLAPSANGDIEPLLDYLRGCGILVLD